MWPNPQFSADLVTYTEKILNGKLYFLFSTLSSLYVVGAQIDYCQIENGGCDQLCYNKCGREVKCGCLPGYRLAYDQKTCVGK